MSATEIDPDRLYPFGVLPDLMPGSRGGRVANVTLHRWRQQGLLKARAIGGGVKKRRWFVLGADLLAFLRGQDEPAPPSPAARKRSRAGAEAEARALGLA